MDKHVRNEVSRVDATREFEGTTVATVVLTVADREQAMWPARHVAGALGYSDPGDLVRVISRDWSDDLDEGRDFVVLTGEALAAAKRAAPDLVDPRAPSLMLLTESGVNLVAILTRQPAGKRLRRWLADEVLPSLRRTGGYGTALAPAAVDRELVVQVARELAPSIAQAVLRELAALRPEPASQELPHQLMVRAFLEECVDRDVFSHVRAIDLYREFEIWTDGKGRRLIPRREFEDWVRSSGFERWASHPVSWLRMQFRAGARPSEARAAELLAPTAGAGGAR